jgi:putative ABC transport system ATP-binding protein
MESTLFKYIKRYSWREQIFLLVLTFTSFPFLYASLELPKIIVNKAIAASDFPKTIYGVQLEQVQYLTVLCGIFLLLVAANGAFKYYINVYKGRLGERMLRRLRYQLFSHVLRFPIPHFRRTSQGEVIAMITSEVEPLGGFIGDAVAQPAFQGGTLLTILVFMFAQDLVLGLAAIALYPLQVYLIPKLQRQVNLLAKERVRTVRRLAEGIGETVSAIEEVHANDTAELHRAQFSRLVGTIYGIRLKIYRKKFFIKFLNNFIAQLTPFFFYSIGGYLVIKGSLTFGALVAVLSAYKDLSSPWKELLDWYQQKEDTRVKYDQLIEQFRPAGLLPEAFQTVSEAPVPRLSGQVVASNLTLEDEAGVKSVQGASFQFDIKERVALVGGAGSGTDDVARLLARLVLPTAGLICIGEHNLATLPESVTGRRLAYVGNHTALIAGTIRHNLHYSLKHRPVRPAGNPEVADDDRQQFIFEAQKSGNTTSHPDDDWIDFAEIGVAGQREFADGTLHVLSFVDLEPDLFDLGLRGTLDPARREELASRILQARRLLRQRLQDRRYAGLVETFDRDRFNLNMSTAENLLFGLPLGDTFDLDRLGDHPYVQKVLDQVDLRDDFFAIGLRVAKIMVDLFQDLPPGHEFFDRFSFIGSDDLPEYQAAIRRVEAAGPSAADPADRNLLSSLPFKLIPARHRLGLGLLDESLERRLLQARRAFAENLPPELQFAVAFFDPDAYNPAASVQDNILFGKLVYGRQQAQREVGALIARVVEELDLRREIVDLGLDFEVGIGGSRLSAAQRQKLGLARVLIKRPDLLVVDHATAALDAAGQAAILAKLLREPIGGGLVWLTSDIRQAELFDRVILMECGRVLEQGSAREVIANQRARSAELAAS